MAYSKEDERKARKEATNEALVKTAGLVSVIVTVLAFAFNSVDEESKTYFKQHENDPVPITKLNNKHYKFTDKRGKEYDHDHTRTLTFMLAENASDTLQAVQKGWQLGHFDKNGVVITAPYMKDNKLNFDTLAQAPNYIIK